MAPKLIHGIMATTLLAALTAGPAWAQGQGERRLSIYADAGGISALRDLNQSGGADLKTGFDLGGGVGWQLQRNVMLRGDLDWSRQRLRNGGTSTDFKLNEFFYGIDLAVRYPNAGRAAPYAFVGAGAVTMHPAGTSGENKTKGVGRFGLGVTYQPPRSKLKLFAQGTGWLYKVNGFPSTSPLAGYDRSQFNLAYTGGVSFHL